jgi:hypothetical protein
MLKQKGASLGGLATHYERTTENPLKWILFGTNKASEREEGKGTSGGEGN